MATLDKTAQSDTPDVLVTFDGSLFLFEPRTDAAREWLEEHTDGQWWGGALVVEHRYAHDLASGLKQDGLVVA